MVNGKNREYAMPPAMCESLEAITFDVGNTFLFPYPSVGTHYAAVAARHGLHMSAADAEARFFDAWRRVPRLEEVIALL